MRVRARQQQHPERRSERAPERQHRVRRAAPKKRPGFVSGESARQDRRRQHRLDAETGEENRVPRHVHDRPQHVVGEIVEATRKAADDRSVRLAVDAQCGNRRIEIGLRDCTAAVVERVREWNLRMYPFEPETLERLRPEEGRCHPQHVHRRADVVDDIRLDERHRPRATARSVRGLEHEHRSTRLRERHGRGQAVRPRAHDHCIVFLRHASAFCFLADR